MGHAFDQPGPRRTATLAISVVLLASCLICFHSLSLAQRRARQSRTTHITARVDYTRFSHRSAAHLQQSCNSCHQVPTANWKTVRKGDAAFPDVTDYPQHASCINCHRQQFFSGAKPAICSVCHAEVSPRGGPRHAFPNPPEIYAASVKGRAAAPSSFVVNFPHEKHQGIISRNEDQPDGNRPFRLLAVSFRQQDKAVREANSSCSVCHQTYQPQGEAADEFVTARPKNLSDEAFWLKKGTFKTTPQGHAACFTCHSPDGGLKPASSDCNICHQLQSETVSKTDFDSRLAETMKITDRTILEKWRKRDSSATFRHEWIMHAELSCATCHHLEVMKTTDAKTLKVPVLSCGGAGTGCHIDQTDPENLLRVEIGKRKTDASFQCTKCHLSFGRDPVPQSHMVAATVKTK